jgi:predicted Zn-dependent protease
VSSAYFFARNCIANNQFLCYTSPMKRIRLFFVALACLGLFLGCATNPLTGKRTMAFVDNSSLFAQSFAAYDEFLTESTVIEGTAEAALVERVGSNIKRAAEVWLNSLGKSEYLNDYQWEYKLVQEDTVNAWCMPGGKIVVYSGILPVTKTEAGLAVVLGHEVCHALLNHGQQSQSASILQQVGAVGVGVLMSGNDESTQASAQELYALGSSIGGTLPFSRANESEADHYGLILMAIAGYDVDEATAFWQRMSAAGSSGTPEFLSTHPSDEKRISNLEGWKGEARETAANLGGK